MAYDDTLFIFALFGMAAVIGWAVGYSLGWLFERVFRR